MDEFIGVHFAPQVSAKKPWRSQINRGGKLFYLGHFERAEDAARAYDNAAHYLRPWASAKAGTRLNYPAEYDSNIPPPNEIVVQARIKLRQILPNAEKLAQVSREMKESDSLEYTSNACLQSIMDSAGQMRRVLSGVNSRIRLLEARVEDLKKDVEKRDRIIEGLRAIGGQQFKRIGNDTVPASPVDSVLG